MDAVDEIDDIEAFITRWSQSEGNERANFHSFANELCQLLQVTSPQPAVADANFNNYSFERSVEFKWADGSKTTGRIDLYKMGSFVMEAKQSREKGRSKAIEVKGQADLFSPDYNPRGRRSANRAWDQLMLNARRQAEDYAKALPPEHGWPPFIIVCDIGHVFEIYADFSGQGKNYAQFPDRQNFRIYMEDLRKEEIRERLRLIWNDPHSLDPAKQSAKVTRDIARRLAEVSKGLEKRQQHDPEEVALFLMRCLFTMFAEDVGLLPEESFTELLQECTRDPTQFVPMVEQLWQAMDKGDFAYAIRKKVRQFNGHLFKDARALPLAREEIGELKRAAEHDWRDVEPAIFGTLLEQALDPKERSRLGAHYTPRAYVERLVVVTVIEPLRQEWVQVEATAERVKSERGDHEAAAIIRAFHDKLCQTRVLDPACGTGNFLYVALELMKRLEGDVLEALAGLGEERFASLEGFNVDPHQFLGLEINPRAVEIAELVLWLGYLQWHFRTRGAPPSEPILRDFKNIKRMDAVLARDENGEIVMPSKRPDWPEAEFIVGNPPFVAGQDLREQFGSAYAETLWQAYPDIPGGADFVMYWWSRAAELTAAGDVLRFGFVTTNSITQTFSRRVVEHHLKADCPVSLLLAIPDHPWTKATRDSAAVRIAMTVGAAGRREGVLRKVVHEAALNTDEPEIGLSASVGRIHADLSIGADVSSAGTLKSNAGLCHDGVKLHGKGFIVTPQQAEHLGLGRREGLDEHIRPYRNGRDLTGILRGVMVIDLFGLNADQVRDRFPEVYQHLLGTVKEARAAQFQKSATRDAKEYLDRWWTFGKPREELRPALVGLNRYIGTADTARHRVFQFLDPQTTCDDGVVIIASEDAFDLGVLCWHGHQRWALRAGGWLGVGNDPRYNKSRCFDPFPFPEASDHLKAQIRTVAEELDAHRKARQAEHPRLTITQMYNVLEKLKAGEALSEDEERIKDEGLVLILKELHERLDALVFEAYGWPVTLSDEEILQRLVDLNAERAAEEARGEVRWLRPEYQIPKFGSDWEKARLEEERRKARAEARAAQGELRDRLVDALTETPRKPNFPTNDELAETAAVMGVLAAARDPMTIDAIARTFSQGLQVKRRVALTVLALARLGHLASPDRGDSFTLRRIA